MRRRKLAVFFILLSVFFLAFGTAARAGERNEYMNRLAETTMRVLRETGGGTGINYKQLASKCELIFGGIWGYWENVNGEWKFHKMDTMDCPPGKICQCVFLTAEQKQLDEPPEPRTCTFCGEKVWINISKEEGKCEPRSKSQAEACEEEHGIWLGDDCMCIPENSLITQVSAQFSPSLVTADGGYYLYFLTDSLDGERYLVLNLQGISGLDVVYERTRSDRWMADFIRKGLWPMARYAYVSISGPGVDIFLLFDSCGNDRAVSPAQCGRPRVGIVKNTGFKRLLRWKTSVEGGTAVTHFVGIMFKAQKNSTYKISLSPVPYDSRTSLEESVKRAGYVTFGVVAPGKLPGDVCSENSRFIKKVYTPVWRAVPRDKAWEIKEQVLDLAFAKGLYRWRERAGRFFREELQSIALTVSVARPRLARFTLGTSGTWNFIALGYNRGVPTILSKTRKRGPAEFTRRLTANWENKEVAWGLGGWLGYETARGFSQYSSFSAGISVSSE